MRNFQLLPGVHVYPRTDGTYQIGINPRNAVVLPHHVAHLFPGANISSETLVAAELDIPAIQALLLNHELAQHTETLASGLSSLDHRARNSLLRETINRPKVQQSRISTAIHIYGGGRLGTTIAVLMAASGFPHIRVIDSSKVQDSDVAPWGASRIDVGLRRDQCASLLIERAHRGAHLRQNYPDTHVERTVAIIVPDQVADSPWFAPNSIDAFMASGTPHMLAGVTSHDAWISHVIEPGLTPCLRCNYYMQCDVDQEWPLISQRLTTHKAIDTAPAALVLHAAINVINRLDTWFDDPSNGSCGWTKWNLPELELGHTGWDSHPACGCSWS
ncbi:MAG: hypothetical protein F2839_03165 [Actinobacteria bacterium]|uniref:Unannotated protein n=1 Tax=freshwater metagenome TaxID=449393 RepID=A0A6J5Z129_9ZZZZ|nr:hypothetical protein [Actinomycetota bacterium]